MGCDELAGTAALESALQRAERAFSELDLPQFTEATDEARALVPCLGEKVPRPLIAETHRFEGLRQFADADPERAAIAFAAARFIEPDYSFPTALVPAENPVRTLYASLDASAPPTASVPEPSVGYLSFDGSASLQRPNAWPTLFQRMGEGGAPIETAYLWPSQAVPAYDVRPEPEPEPVAEVVPGPAPIAHGTEASVEPKGSFPTGWVVTAGASAVTAGALYGLAWQQRSAFSDEQTAVESLPGLKGRNRAFTVGAGLAGGVAVGAGVGALVQGVF